MNKTKIFYTKKNSIYKGKKIVQNIPLFLTTAILNNAEEQFYLLLDTGSNGSILNLNGLKEFSKIDTSIIENELYVQLISFNNFIINLSLKFYIDKNAKLTSIDDSPNHIGLIGMDLLCNYVLIINYKENYFKLSKSISKEVKKSNHYLFENKFLFLIIKIKNKAFKLIFDTGMNGDYILFEKSIVSLEIDNLIIQEKHTGNGHQGNIYEIEYYENEVNLEYNNYNHLTNLKMIKNHPFFDQYNFDGIIGNDFFENNIIEIDYINETFKLKLK